jgi:hypothetical protein
MESRRGLQKKSLEDLIKDLSPGQSLRGKKLALIKGWFKWQKFFLIPESLQRVIPVLYIEKLSSLINSD